MDTHTPNPADPIRVTAHRAIPDSPFHPSLASLFHTDLATDLRRARLLADWLDTKFEFAGFRFGFDTLIGLVPVAGDTLTTLLGLYPILVARHHKLGKLLQTKMALLLAADWLVGLVPLLGDLLDTAFKANVRNVRMLEKALAKRTQP